MMLPPPLRASCVRLPASAPLPADEDAAELAGLERCVFGSEPDHRVTCRPRRRISSSQSMEAVG